MEVLTDLILDYAMRIMNIIALSVYCWLKIVVEFCFWIAYIVDGLAYGLEETPSVDYVRNISEKTFDLLFYRWMKDNND